MRRSPFARGCSSRATSTFSSPRARQTRPRSPDGGTIPVAHTSDPVQIDQLFDALPADIRRSLQLTLQGFGQSLDTTPSAAQDLHLDPAVRGLTGAQAINKTFDTSVPSLRDSAIVSGALTGPSNAPLSGVISGFARASSGLARADGQLSAFISDFDRTLQATAAQQQGLRQTVRLLGPTARNARLGFASLDALVPGHGAVLDRVCHRAAGASGDDHGRRSVAGPGRTAAFPSQSSAVCCTSCGRRRPSWRGSPTGSCSSCPRSMPSIGASPRCSCPPAISSSTTARSRAVCRTTRSSGPR